ncbi:cation diffusion facilitator family transporter [Oricola cellulosilytica]|uniref:Protein p34 n=1 Tax=Oricola cellulosilytica TaxID=1429082 RepID=A0A4R0PFI6_9HYPH|nr:cation diffusion facilitator family transporter [Oricola cellulosilytica]TCD15359.1 cation transporter [Oricola cellulosilytica]
MPERKRAALVQRLAIASIGVAVAVLAMKFAAWRLTGSVALFSDALESIVNVVAATAAFIAVRYAHKPADRGHPFGHHKAEYMSAVVEGVMIVIAALLILREATVALVTGNIAISEPGLGLGLNLVAAIVNGVLAMVLIRAGRALRSPALAADGRHIMADVVTSAGVLAGLVLALLTGWLWLDPVLAIVVAVNIVREGWRVISDSIGGLMDRAATGEEEARMRAAILANAGGAIEVHDIRTRTAGPATFIEFHLVVDGAMTVEESHAICDRIEDGLRDEIPGARVVIHVEPDHKTKDEALKVG